MSAILHNSERNSNATPLVVAFRANELATVFIGVFAVAFGAKRQATHRRSLFGSFASLRAEDVNGGQSIESAKCRDGKGGKPS